LSVGALEPQFWFALCERLERPDLVDDAFAMGERRTEVIGELEDVFRTRTRGQWMELFGDLDVCVGPINDMREAFEDPQLLHRDMVVEDTLPDGTAWRHVGNPLRLAGAPGEVKRLPPPQMGEHTDEVLSEAGFTGDEVEELRKAGAV
jgi:crotonobetainyl-CoA:carnitine CoA-transferase CaiB-like acyl-CoA transferase